MCGICGVFGERDDRAVEAMVGAMRHRGPDDNGTFSDEKASLGMARLAIIDITPTGHQPMTIADGLLTIVYNGETYNYLPEREILEAKGYKFRSTSDTEVVLRMYEEYGDDFVTRLRGMFGLAIYDRRRGPGKERLYLARDHFGIKPLLYAYSGGKFVFASEIKTLLASGLVSRDIDPEGLRYLLTYGSVYQPKTILKDVRMLPPAHRMIIENGEERIERYWSLGIDRQPELKQLEYAELVERVGDVLEESVRLHMVSDVPVGAFLSGGIDSSLMTALMARNSPGKVKTFSVGFGSEGSQFDESDEAEQTSRFIGTDHTRVDVTPEDIRRDIEHFAFGLDQPSIDGINTYYVARAARRDVTVAISGNGGDELFAGYPSFIFMQRDQARTRHAPMKAFARSVASAVSRSSFFDPIIANETGKYLDRARNLEGFTARYGNLWQVFGVRGAARMLHPHLRKDAMIGRSLHFDLSEIDELKGGSAIERVTGLSLRGYNNNQLLRDTDAVSMIHSLELRVPFLDRVVADTALSLPDSAKLGDISALQSEVLQTYRASGAKRILLDIGKKMLPPDFDSKPKRGFAMPFESWMRGSLKEVLLDTLSDESVKRRGLIDADEASAVRTEFLDGDSNWMKPWLLMTLELWCRQVLDGPAADFCCDGH